MQNRKKESKSIAHLIARSKVETSRLLDTIDDIDEAQLREILADVNYPKHLKSAVLADAERYADHPAFELVDLRPRHSEASIGAHLLKKQIPQIDVSTQTDAPAPAADLMQERDTPKPAFAVQAVEQDQTNAIKIKNAWERVESLRQKILIEQPVQREMLRLELQQLLSDNIPFESDYDQQVERLIRLIETQKRQIDEVCGQNKVLQHDLYRIKEELFEKEKQRHEDTLLYDALQEDLLTQINNVNASDEFQMMEIVQLNNRIKDLERFHDWRVVDEPLAPLRNEPIPPQAEDVGAILTEAKEYLQKLPELQAQRAQLIVTLYTNKTIPGHLVGETAKIDSNIKLFLEAAKATLEQLMQLKDDQLALRQLRQAATQGSQTEDLQPSAVPTGKAGQKQLPKARSSTQKVNASQSPSKKAPSPAKRPAAKKGSITVIKDREEELQAGEKQIASLLVRNYELELALGNKAKEMDAEADERELRLQKEQLEPELTGDAEAIEQVRGRDVDVELSHGQSDDSLGLFGSLVGRNDSKQSARIDPHDMQALTARISRLEQSQLALQMENDALRQQVTTLTQTGQQ